MSQPTPTTNPGYFDFWTEAAEHPLIDRLFRVFSVMRWDGVLPFIAPCSTLLAGVFLGPGHPVAVVGTLFVPIAVALARAALAQKQLDRAGNGLLRTFGLAIAIALLLLFEILSSVLGQVPDAPLSVWGIAGLLYATYLLFIYFTLCPASASHACPSPIFEAGSKAGFPTSRCVLD